MTAQINDTFKYRGGEYAVAGISEGELFDPSLLDLQPKGTCSACWRGYHAVFGLSGSRLVLDELHVNLLANGKSSERVQGPEINGVTPAGPRNKHDWFNNHYAKLDYHLEYTGGLLLADGFIRELYVHMGFHPAWKYKTVHELVFAGGALKAEHDRSERMREVREQFIEWSKEAGERPGKLSRKEIEKFVERAFDRRYRM